MNKLDIQFLFLAHFHFLFFRAPLYLLYISY